MSPEAIANEGTPVGDVDLHLRQLVQVVYVIRVAATHDLIHDDVIDLDSGYAGATVGQGTDDVHASTWADDGEFAARPKHIGDGRRGAYGQRSHLAYGDAQETL